MINLRPYQENIITEIKKLYARKKKRILITAPTGSGKTVVFSFLAKSTSEKGNKVLILTNRTELLTQAGGSLNRIGINSFYIKAGAKYVSNDVNVYIAMSQTLKNRVELPYWKEFLDSISLVIVDEQHLQDFNFIFDTELNNKHILGFTATPKRSGKQRQLGVDYEEIIESVTVKELIEQDFLVDCDYYGCSVPDLTKVGFDSKSGDYKNKQLYEAFNQTKLYAGVVRNWDKICPNTKTIVFCCNIQHAIKTCKEFNDNGIKAKFLVSDVSKPQYPKHPTEGSIIAYNGKLEAYNEYCQAVILYSAERDLLLEQFERGDYYVLVNVDTLTTGFDCPSIETIIMNRATLSTALWLQILGRGSRPYEGKTHFNVLDFGDNQSRLGTYSEDRNWSLWHEESKGGGIAPIKRCGFDSKDRPIYAANNTLRADMFNTRKLDGCGVLIHAGLTICPFCGFKYPDKEIKEVDLETIYLDSESMEFKRTKPISQMSDVELNDYQLSKGHNIAWLWRQVYMRGSYKNGIAGGMQRIDSQIWDKKIKEKAKFYCKKFA